MTAVARAELAAWLAAARDPGVGGPCVPYVWFGFGTGDEVLTVDLSADGVDWRRAGKGYLPAGQAAHTVRDPDYLAWADRRFLAHTWGGLVGGGGAFATSRSVSLAEVVGWPLEVVWRCDLSFAAMYPSPAAGDVCFAPDALVDGGTLSVLANCRPAGGAFAPGVVETAAAAPAADVYKDGVKVGDALAYSGGPYATLSVGMQAGSAALNGTVGGLVVTGSVPPAPDIARLGTYLGGLV